jgi:hypothetical protein
MNTPRSVRENNPELGDAEIRPCLGRENLPSGQWKRKSRVLFGGDAVWFEVDADNTRMRRCVLAGSTDFNGIWNIIFAKHTSDFICDVTMNGDREIVENTLATLRTSGGRCLEIWISQVP